MKQSKNRNHFNFLYGNINYITLEWRFDMKQNFFEEMLLFEEKMEDVYRYFYNKTSKIVSNKNTSPKNEHDWSFISNNEDFLY